MAHATHETIGFLEGFGRGLLVDVLQVTLEYGTESAGISMRFASEFSTVVPLTRVQKLCESGDQSEELFRF